MRSRTRTRSIHWIAILIGAVIMLAPLLYMVSASLMTPTEVNDYPPRLFPSGLNWGSYAEAYKYLTTRTILNSFIFCIGILLTQLVVGLPAGFALAKIPFRGSALLLGFFIVPMFLPNDISLIPLYIVTRELGIVNTYAGMIIPIAGSTAFATLLFRQSIVNLPNSLVDAARIDGAGWGRVLVSIVLPLSKPAIATYSSITFLTAWNMYIWPLIVAPDPNLRVVPVALAPLAQGNFQEFVTPNVTMSAAVISTLPVLAVFLLSQKWYVRGLAGSDL